MTRTTLVCLLALLAAPLLHADDAARLMRRGPLQYPETRKQIQIDNYFGHVVADPYRWLEDDNSAETKAWVVAQNKVTRAYLDAIPGRSRIAARMKELVNYERYRVPFEEGGRYFFSKNDGLQNQSVFYVADSLDGTARALLDPNKLSEDGTVALRGTWVSHDGRHMVYALSSAGSDWREFKVRDVATGKDLPNDHLKWIKFSGASWAADGSGFYYTRMPKPQAGAGLTAVNRQSSIWFHRIGTSQAEDTLVYARPEKKNWGLYGGVTRDGRWLEIYVSTGSSSENGMFVRDLSKPDQPVQEILGAFDASYSLLGSRGSTLFVETDKDAPRGRIVAIDATNPAQAAWRTIVPESTQSIEDARYIGGRFVVHYLEKAQSSVRLFDEQGKTVGQVPLPGPGSVFGITGQAEDEEMFFAFSSFTYPTTVFRYDLTTGKSAVKKRPQVQFDPEAYESRQVTYKSKDGTPVTMFVTHRKALTLDGSNPTILYGYGGFNNSMTPWFSTSNVVWMEMGGVFAVANLRGGGEYGEAWHKAGMLEKKQNVFDDFIAAAEHLIAKGYTSPQKLAIQGGSNGGLLVGACMNQRPELFGACLPAVGVMDMLRYHKFTIGWAWATEYGSSDQPQMIEPLLAYSPLHNLRHGVKYPATMVTTADHDDRVVPAHSFKYAARLQECHGGTTPVLIRIESKAGHGAGTPIAKVIEATADRFAFLVANLGMNREASKSGGSRASAPRTND